MTKPDYGPNDTRGSRVPVAAFGQHANRIEYALAELIEDIKLADSYQGDDAIVYAVGLLGTTHTLQSYLFSHFDELIREKKMKAYAEQADKK
jgi:predicted metal-dependent phosphoesterase TrpH